MILRIILLNIFLTAKQQHFKLVSYLDEEQNPIKLKFDDRLPFVPEDLGLEFEIYANSEQYFPVVLERKSILLTKTDRQSADAVKYHVPITTYPIINIRITLFWGYERYVIDEFEIFLKSDFKESLHSLSGFLGRSVLDILLLHQTSSQEFSIERSYSLLHKEWNKNFRTLKSGESICISFFTFDFSDILVLSNPYRLFHQTKYSLFTFVTKPKQVDKSLDQQKYLTKAFPCVSSRMMSKKLKIFVDPKTSLIEIGMSWKVGSATNRYLLSDGIFTKLFSLKDLEFEPLDVISTPLTQSIVGKGVGVLLYDHEIKQKNCVKTSIEKEFGLKFSLSLEKRFRDVLLDSYTKIVDMSASSLGVYKLRRARRVDMVAC